MLLQEGLDVADNEDTNTTRTRCTIPSNHSATNGNETIAKGWGSRTRNESPHSSCIIREFGVRGQWVTQGISPHNDARLRIRDNGRPIPTRGRRHVQTVNLEVSRKCITIAHPAADRRLTK